MGGGPHSLAPHILNKQNTAQNMAKPAHSQIGGFGGVGGGTWSRRFSLWRFFLHVHGKTVHFLNIQEV